ncbi:MAG: outer membrane beta-barrel protein, partial [Bryobacteraceae bacterium]
VPITDALNSATGDRTSYFTNTKRYSIGPTAEVRLPLGFSFEVDALYRRLGFDYSQFGVDTYATSRTVANSWQFPLLLKWGLSVGPVKPFVDAGASIEHLIGINQVRQLHVIPSIITTTSTGNPAELDNSTRAGFTFGGGVEFKAGPIRISPELRYTRWNSDSFRDPIGALLKTNLNQGDFLLGISF